MTITELVAELKTKMEEYDKLRNDPDHRWEYCTGSADAYEVAWELAKTVAEDMEKEKL